MRLSLKKRILVGIGLIFILTTITTGIVIYNTIVIDNELSLLLNQFDKVSSMAELRYNLINENANIRAYMLYGDRIFLERFKESANRAKQLIDEVQVVRSERKPLIIQIRDLHNRYITDCEQEIIPLVIPDQPVNIEAVISAECEGVSLAKELVVLTGRLEELRQQDTLNLIHTAIYNENVSKVLVIIFSILTVLVGGLFTILLIIN